MLSAQTLTHNRQKENPNKSLNQHNGRNANRGALFFALFTSNLSFRTHTVNTLIQLDRFFLLLGFGLLDLKSFNCNAQQATKNNCFLQHCVNVAKEWMADCITHSHFTRMHRKEVVFSQYFNYFNRMAKINSAQFLKDSMIKWAKHQPSFPKLWTELAITCGEIGF